MNNERKHPKLKACLTAGELIKQLQRVPADMPLTCSCEDGVTPVVFNAGRPDEFLGLESNDGCWDDEAETEEDI